MAVSSSVPSRPANKEIKRQTTRSNTSSQATSSGTLSSTHTTSLQPAAVASRQNYIANTCSASKEKAGNMQPSAVLADDFETWWSSWSWKWSAVSTIQSNEAVQVLTRSRGRRRQSTYYMPPNSLSQSKKELRRGLPKRASQLYLPHPLPHQAPFLLRGNIADGSSNPRPEFSHLKRNTQRSL